MDPNQNTLAMESDYCVDTSNHYFKHGIYFITYTLCIFYIKQICVSYSANTNQTYIQCVRIHDQHIQNLSKSIYPSINGAKLVILFLQMYMYIFINLRKHNYKEKFRLFHSFKNSLPRKLVLTVAFNLERNIGQERRHFFPLIMKKKILC